MKGFVFRIIMLHQENSEVFVRHHSEQLACGNLRGTDDGRSNFLPDKYHIATGIDWHFFCIVQACLDSCASLVLQFVKKICRLANLMKSWS
jgi:hypothetical protein